MYIWHLYSIFSGRSMYFNNTNKTKKNTFTFQWVFSPKKNGNGKMVMLWKHPHRIYFMSIFSLSYKLPTQCLVMSHCNRITKVSKPCPHYCTWAIKLAGYTNAILYQINLYHRNKNLQQHSKYMCAFITIYKVSTP